MILLVNNQKIMGKHINKPAQNIIGWSSIVILVGLSITLYPDAALLNNGDKISGTNKNNSLNHITFSILTD